jgi:hypothetical protein
MVTDRASRGGAHGAVSGHMAQHSSDHATSGAAKSKAPTTKIDFIAYLNQNLRR